MSLFDDADETIQRLSVTAHYRLEFTDLNERKHRIYCDRLTKDDDQELTSSTFNFFAIYKLATTESTGLTTTAELFTVMHTHLARKITLFISTSALEDATNRVTSVNDYVLLKALGPIDDPRILSFIVLQDEETDEVTAQPVATQVQLPDSDNESISTTDSSKDSTEEVQPDPDDLADIFNATDLQEAICESLNFVKQHTSTQENPTMTSTSTQTEQEPAQTPNLNTSLDLQTQDFQPTHTSLENDLTVFETFLQYLLQVPALLRQYTAKEEEEEARNLLNLVNSYRIRGDTEPRCLTKDDVIAFIMAQHRPWEIEDFRNHKLHNCNFGPCIINSTLKRSLEEPEDKKLTHHEWILDYCSEAIYFAYVKTRRITDYIRLQFTLIDEGLFESRFTKVLTTDNFQKRITDAEINSQYNQQQSTSTDRDLTTSIDQHEDEFADQDEVTEALETLKLRFPLHTLNYKFRTFTDLIQNITTNSVNLTGFSDYGDPEKRNAILRLAQDVILTDEAN
jgi:hypothetical protein